MMLPIIYNKPQRKDNGFKESLPEFYKNVKLGLNNVIFFTISTILLECLTFLLPKSIQSEISNIINENLAPHTILFLFTILCPLSLILSLVFGDNSEHKNKSCYNCNLYKLKKILYDFLYSLSRFAKSACELSGGVTLGIIVLYFLKCKHFQLPHPMQYLIFVFWFMFDRLEFLTKQKVNPRKTCHIICVTALAFSFIIVWAWLVPIQYASQLCYIFN